MFQQTMSSLLRQLRNVLDLVYTGRLSGLKVDAGEQEKRILRTKAVPPPSPSRGRRETQGSFLRAQKHRAHKQHGPSLP